MYIKETKKIGTTPCHKDDDDDNEKQRHSITDDDDDDSSSPGQVAVVVEDTVAVLVVVTARSLRRVNSWYVACSFRLYSPNVSTFHALRDIRSESNCNDCKCNVSYVRRRCPRIMFSSFIHCIISAREYPSCRNKSSRICAGMIISRPNRRGARFSSNSSRDMVHSASCFHPIEMDGPEVDAGLSPIDRG